MEAPTLTLITPTGNRPEAFALCETYMARQTVKWDEWIVVDDGDPPTPTSLGQMVIRPQPLWRPGQTTQYRNLLLGLEAARGDYVCVIEDDDWYGPNYLSNTVRLLVQKYDLVGETPSRYYHVARCCWRDMKNRHMASLCQTGFRRRTVASLLVALCRREVWLDTTLWRTAARGVFRYAFHSGAQVVGIKGMPGRGGMSTAHFVQGVQWNTDREGTKLREWVGSDAETYRRYAHA
jgi:glycosyltransferase involved in cell wall biosynthesis